MTAKRIHNLDSANFWRKVLQSYNNSIYNEYLCIAAPAFNDEWNVNADEIRRLGTSFLNDAPEFTEQVYVPDRVHTVLFRSTDPNLPLKQHVRINVRLAFLKWNIKRCTK